MEHEQKHIMIRNVNMNEDTENNKSMEIPTNYGFTTVQRKKHRTSNIKLFKN